MLLKNKVALVVGIKDKIGSTTAKLMAQEGAKVVVSDRNYNRGTALVEAIRDAGGEAIYQEINVTLNKYQTALIQRIVTEYGRLDIAFNNVSVDGDYFPLAQQDEGMVAGIIDTNFNGMWLSMKYQIEQMLKNDGGVIINSVSNFKSDGSDGCSIYRATKAAVATMSQGAAFEYAQSNIRINAIAPIILEPITKLKSFMENNGYRVPDSTIIPMGDSTKFQEIADTVVWLCSERASSIAGQIINVDVEIQTLAESLVI